MKVHPWSRSQVPSTHMNAWCAWWSVFNSSHGATWLARLPTLASSQFNWDPFQCIRQRVTEDLEHEHMYTLTHTCTHTHARKWNTDISPVNGGHAFTIFAFIKNESFSRSWIFGWLDRLIDLVWLLINLVKAVRLSVRVFHIISYRFWGTHNYQPS